jgi:hypothetical protein
MVSQLLDRNSIPLSPAIACAIGSGEATVLQQLYFCLTRPQMGTKEDGRTWIRNPVKCQNAKKKERAQKHGKAIDWLSNFPFLTVDKIRRIFTKLEALGLVISRKLKASQWDQCKYYTINWTQLAELLESLSLPICGFPTNRFNENEEIDLAIDRKSYQDTTSNIVLQELKRDTANTFLTQEKEKAAESQEIITEKTQEFLVHETDYSCDNFSATVAPGYSSVERMPPAESQAIPGNDELREFQRQLRDLGQQLGRRIPEAWAFKIVENFLEGKPCKYWEEFKAGVPLGTCDQREWEVAPGVPCAIAVQCVEQDFLSRPGTTPTEAARKAALTFTRPDEVAAIWEAIKSRVMFLKEQRDRQSEMGVQCVVVDPYMIVKPKVSVEKAVIALHELVSALPPELQSAQDVPMLGECDSHKVGVEGGDIVLATDVELVDGAEAEATEKAAKAKIAATLNKFARSKFARPGKQRAIIEENITEVRGREFATPVQKTSSSGALVDCLQKFEIIDW